MNTHGSDDAGREGDDGTPPVSVHESVGAYALGVLDEDDAADFEEHLAGCERCAQDLEEMLGVTPLLATLAGLPAEGVPALPAAPVTPEPGPGLARKLFAEVAAGRSRRRRRARYLVAAAAVLVVGGPLTVVAVDGGGHDTSRTVQADEDQQLRAMPQELRATDATTKVSATLGLEPKAWGTHTMLELKNVKGPLKCSLIAYGKDGGRETLASWAVPARGYGIEDSSYKSAKYPLYVHGGASLPPNRIDHFEVRTLDGKRLVSLHS